MENEVNDREWLLSLFPERMLIRNLIATMFDDEIKAMLTEVSEPLSLEEVRDLAQKIISFCADKARREQKSN